MYMNGLRVEPNNETTIGSLKEAKEPGSPARIFMTVVWLRELGQSEMAMALLKVAEKYSTGVMVALGTMYESGHHVSVVTLLHRGCR